MRKPLVFTCLLLSVFCLSSVGLAKDDPLLQPTDLGQGLGYLRVHQLDEAIKPIAGSGALVLDLRHTTATPEAVTSFAATLSFRSPSSTLFVLVGPDTPAGLTSALKGNFVSLGIKGSHPEPQVVVEQTAEADHAAYDAGESGTALASLIAGKIEKERFDEATLVHEFKNGNHDAHPPEANPAKPAGSPTALTDRVLQRAVHLHHALLALKH